MTTVVIMPGGFHPFHPGHLALYQSAQRTFPDAEVYVAATNDKSDRPFDISEKQKIAYAAGVEPGHFVQVKSPFRAEEIASQYNPNRDVLIFVRSEKDANTQPQAGGVKKDGSASYLQPLLGAKRLEPFAQHAYMAYLPTVEFGPGAFTSASQIRTAWPKLTPKRRLALVMSLYPSTQKNPAGAQDIVSIFDQNIGDVAEDISRRGFLRGAGAVAAGTALGGVAQASEQPDPNKLIARVSMAGDTKEFDLTGRFKGDAKSQLSQASDWLSEFLEAREIDFSDFELRYQGKLLKTKNTAANLGMLNRESIEKSNRRYDENQGWAATYEDYVEERRS